MAKIDRLEIPGPISVCFYNLYPKDCNDIPTEHV